MSLPSLLNFDIKPPPQRVEMANEVAEEVAVAEEAEDEEPNFIHPQPTQEDADRVIDDLQETIDLDFVKKPDIVENEIFADAPPRKMGRPTRSTSPKKVKRARKELSEEDKQKRRDALARGRETRRLNLAKKKALEAEARQLDQQQQEMVLEDKQLDLEIQNAKLNKKAKKVKQVIIQDTSSEEEQIEYVKRPKKKAPRSPTPVRSSITAEDIERSQLNTLLAYEKMRKDRKEEKKRVKQIEEQQKQIKQTMSEVNNQWGRHRGAGKYGNLLANMGL